MTIIYHTGSVTKPVFTDSPRIIVHCCNDKGAWHPKGTRGVSGAISAAWPITEKCYRLWARGQLDQPFALGEVQLLEIEENIPTPYDVLQVANLVGQHDIKWVNQIPPVRYDALIQGFRELDQHAFILQATLHMPRLGAGHAGGDWHIIERLIDTFLARHEVHVYDLPKAKI